MRSIRFAILAIATIDFGSVAFAADIPMKAPVAFPAYNWTGFYLGIEGGAGWGSSKHSTAAIAVDFSGTFDVNGGIVGGTAGYNWQTGLFVFGIEGDLSSSSIKGSTRV